MDGSSRERVLVAPGFVGPWGLACAPDGTLHVVDGLSLAAIAPDGSVRRGPHALEARSPGFVRAIACDDAGTLWLATARGDVWRSLPDGAGFARCAEKVRPLAGIAVAADGGAVVTAPRSGELVHVGRSGASAVIATGLAEPWDVTSAGRRGFLVCELAKGRVSAVARSGAVSTLAEGFEQPRGLALRGERLFVLDGAARTLSEIDLAGGSRRVVASALPVGAQGPVSFAGGLAVGPDGSIYLAADREGTVLRLRTDATALRG
jgi:sugar lactone lactonase YvrE